MQIHLSNSRGFADHGWLKSRHTFSFADYHDPSRMGFGALRVINDDFVEAGMGFGKHAHRDMEIVSIPLEGSLKHEDSVGNSSIIKKGEIQIMSAGAGIFHSEHNASIVEPVKFLQIWILPKKLGIQPRYEQRAFGPSLNEFRLVVSPNGEADSISINQDSWFSLAQIEEGKGLRYVKYRASSGVYVFLIDGALEVLGHKLNKRDGLGITEESPLLLKASKDSEVLLMEVPMQLQL
jgi:redox-sensitive bicupin YhaK (pirin superfamily)